MASDNPGDVTLLLEGWGSGDREALDRLVPLVYAELRQLSRHYLNMQPQNRTLQTTDLINEVFVRLIDQLAEPGSLLCHRRANDPQCPRGTARATARGTNAEGADDRFRSTKG